MQRIADGFGTLVRDHLALARIEFIEDAKKVGGDAAQLAAFGPFLMLGYALLCVAGSLAIGLALGPIWGFLIVGVVNVLIGIVGLGLAMNKLKQRRVLGKTAEELRATSELLSAVTHGETPSPASSQQPLAPGAALHITPATPERPHGR